MAAIGLHFIVVGGNTDGQSACRHEEVGCEGFDCGIDNHALF